MKENIKKLFAILVLFILIINSSFLLVISTAVDEIEKLIDESKIKPVIEVNLEKYVNYNISEESKGVLLQTNIKTGIEYEESEGYTPIKATKTVVNLPQIDGRFPETIEVLAKSTKATNGDDNGKDMYYSYDKESGKLEIVVDNKENDNGDIYTENVNGARDEFIVISNYSSDCYSDENLKRNLNVSGTVEEILTNENATKLSNSFTSNFEVTENISGLISTEVITSDIYNGYIYANSQNSTNYATEYTENFEIDISKKELSDEIKIDTMHAFIDKNNNEKSTDEIIYKSTKIDKSKALDILGEDGYLQILNENGDVLGELNKDTEVGENNIYEITYDNGLNKIIIKTSKPLKVGTIILQNTKEIKGTMTDIENNRIQVKNNITCINNIQEKNEETGEIIKNEQKEIYSFSNDNVSEIKDSETRVDLSIDKTEWTNNVQNDVVMTATLVTNDMKYNLFKNPIIEISLPSEVENVILGNVFLLYDDNLKINNAEVIERDNGKTIRIEIGGTQNQYTLNSLINGANVIIPATIIVKKDIQSVNTEINMVYVNENGVQNNTNNEKIGIIIDSISDTKSTEEINEVKVENIEVNNNISENDISIDVKAFVGSKELVDGDIVYEQQIIKYEVTVTNKTEKNIDGISITGQIPDGTVYGTVNLGTYWEGEYDYIKDEGLKEYDFGIDSLKPNQSITNFYEVIVNNLEDSEESKEIVNRIDLKNGDEIISSKEIKHVEKKAKMVTFLKSYIGRDEKNSFHYWLYIKNISDQVLNNVEIETADFGEELIFKESQLEGSEATKNFGDFENNIYKAVIDKIEPGEVVTIKLFVNVGNFKDNVNEVEEKLSFKAEAMGTDTYYSNENRRPAYPEYVTVTQTLDKEGEKVEPNTQLTYKVTIKNESKIRTQVNILDYLPERVYGETATFEKWIFPDDDLVTTYDLEQEATKEYERQKTTIDISSTILDQNGDPLGDIYYQHLFIPAGRTLEIVFTVRTAEVSEPTVISNYMTVSGEYIHTKVSNTVSCTIVPTGYLDPDNPDNPEDPEDPEDPDDPDDPDNPDNPDNPDDPDKNTYNISGLVWLDKDENGIRDRENTISGITVKIYNADNQTILKDSDGNSKILTTDANGAYQFSEIPKGRYLILFEFNTQDYDITEYQVSGASDNVNSDVVLKNVYIDGIQKTVGITDIITVNSNNIANIDMGLIYKAKFDFKLDKYISKITVTNSNGTKEYNYDDEKLAKIEIPSKQVNNTTVEIQYKIRVTNEGTVDGYVTEILDYLPDGFSINDTNWQVKNNGNIGTNILSGTKISSGESKEILLVVTKKLSSEALGQFINTAEIGSSLNTKNLKDIDSVEGNKDTNEDDFSEAQVIISVKTGLVRNITIIFILCLMISIIAYFIYTKKIKIRNIFKIFSILLVIVIFVQSNAVKADIDITGWTNDNHVYPGDDGNNYICMDNGNAMCHIHHHWYKVTTEITDQTSTEISRVEEYVNASKDDSDIEFSINNARYKVGPYKVSWDYGSITEISGKYVTNDGKNIKTHDITSSQIIKSESGKTATIYFDLPLTTIEVKDVSVKLIHKDGIQITTETKWRQVYEGVSYDLAEGEDADSHEHSTSLQKMKKEGWDSSQSTTKQDISDTVYFATKTWYGNVKIVKKDKDTDSLLENAKFKITGGPANITITKKTDENGEIKFNKLQPGSYTITEIEAPSGYDVELQASSEKIEVVSNGKTRKVTFKNKQYGDLSLIKVDQSTFDKMNGVGFVIFKEEDGTRKYIRNYKYKEDEPATVSWTANINNAMYFYTGIQGTKDSDGYIVGNCTSNNGRVVLRNLPVRNSSGEKITYWAEEYKFDYDKNPDLIYYRLDKTKTVKTKLITNAYNKNSSDEHKISLMKRVTKEFYTSDYVKEMIKDKDALYIVQAIYGTIMDWNPSTNFREQYVNYLNQTKTSNGYDTSAIENMIDDIYSLPENQIILQSRVSTIFRSNDSIREYRDLLFSNIGIQGDDVKQSMKDYCYYGLKSETMVIMKNKQYTIDIRGYVWEDIATSKSTERNDLYKNTIEDIKDCMATDVVVRLYAELNQEGQLPTLITTTDEDGYKFKGAEFVLDKNGNQVLDENGDPKIQYNIKINNLSKYYIEFEYNGLKYQNVFTEKEKYGSNNNNYIYNMENTSKAEEIDNDRTNLNNSFATIVGGTSSTATNSSNGKTEGYSVDNNGNSTNRLIYDSGDYKSKLLSDENKEYSVASVQNKIIPIGNSTGVSIKASTNTAFCNFKDMYDLLPDGAREISNINLGLYERPQPDLAVATDIENIQLTINGSYSHTYEYKNRSPYINSGLPDSDINPGYDATLDGFSVRVKNSAGNYKDCTYVREIYDSYIAYTKNDEDSPNRLRVFVTYKLVVKNESGSLVSRVSLNNYADTRLENPESYYMDGNNRIPLVWTQLSNGTWQTGQIAKNINPTECMEIYLRYELNTKTIVSLAELGTNESLSISHNVTEINSYSTWDKSGNIYGGVDKDSAPNNIIYDTISTYEDDTDVAPDLKFERKTSKVISGTVFEDSTSPNLQSGKERKGNSRYDDNDDNEDNKVENVDVKILNYGENDPAKLYNLNNSGEVVVTNAQAITNADGTYSFTGLVPGEYFIQYTYGCYDRVDLNDANKTKSIQSKIKTETGEINVTTESYKSTIVDKSKFETLLENNIEKDDGYDVIKENYETNENAGTGQNALWYWYENPNNFSYSSAVDDSTMRHNINSYLSIIDYAKKSNYDNVEDNIEYHYIKANTGIMDIAIEDYRNQVTDDTYVEGSREYQIKFGIVERPRQSLQVNKEISNIRITLSNGQILLQGDPREEEINYVTYPEQGPLKIEIDNEIIEGATLDLTYEISVDNKSERDYDDDNYYRYGVIDESKLVKIKLNSIVDYVDEKLSVTYDIGENNSDFVYYDSNNSIKDKWQIIRDEDKKGSTLAGIDIDSAVYNSIRNRSNIVVRNTDIEISPTESTKISLVAKKLLSNLSNNDNVFDNYTELIQVYNPLGRFYGEMFEENKNHWNWVLRTPGNFNITKISDTDECDNSNYNRYDKYITNSDEIPDGETPDEETPEPMRTRDAKLVIIPPTGAGTIIAYCVIGVICLIILSGGIILIKKKVLDQ